MHTISNQNFYYSLGHLASPHFAFDLSIHPFFACSVIVSSPPRMNGVNNQKTPLSEISAR